MNKGKKVEESDVMEMWQKHYYLFYEKNSQQNRQSDWETADTKCEETVLFRR
jgi:hypothetical protein